MKLEYRIVPAILTNDPAALASMARQVETFTDWAQIDIMDGRFVPSNSVGPGDIVKADLRIGWEAHLMVENPGRAVEEFARAGAKRIIFHYEAVKEYTLEAILQISCLGVTTGIALNPETPNEVLNSSLLAELDCVLFMAVHPGFYGAKFIPEVLVKVRALRAGHPGMNIGIDGGIKLDNVMQAASAGANEICVGSAVFAQPDPASAYVELLKRARQGWQTPG